MKKEFYNIWIILIFFTFLFSKTSIGNKSTRDLEIHQLNLTILQNSSVLKTQDLASYGDSVTASVSPSFAQICTFETLQITASGGDNYLWIPNPGNPSGGVLNNYNIPNPFFSNGFPGSFYVYDVIVTDNNFPPNGDTATVIISILINPVISILPFPGVFVCENEAVILTASGGNTYRWEDAVSGDSLGIGTTLNISPSTTTTYRATGTDSNGCWENNEITIFVEEINAFANASASGFCEGDSVLLTGGTGNQLTWFENNNVIGYGSSIYVSPTQTTTYNLSIQNTSGCQDTAQIIVEYYNPPVVLNPINDFINCSGNAIPLSIQINQPIQSYSIDGSGVFGNDEIHGNLLTFDAISSADTSSFSVTMVGENGGCSVVETFNILPCNCIPPTVSSISIEEAKCGGKNGSAMVYIENEGAYLYNWTPNLGMIQGAGNERTALPSGSYNIEIVDTSNLECSTFINVLMTNSNGPMTSFETTPANCSLSDGTAILSPSSFNYLWEDLEISNSRNDLSSGNYFVTVTDPLIPNCSNVILIEINEENPLSATLTVDNSPDCDLNNGSISIQVLNGSGDYTFSWRDGLITSDSVRNDLFSGVYEVIIIENDSSACELPFQFVLSNNTETAEIVVDEIINTACNGLANGRVDFTINFDTSFVFDADTIITDGSLIYKNGELPAGEYCLFLHDGNDCVVASECFEIENPEFLDVLFKIEPDCGIGGSIDLIVSGGTAPYFYNWSDIPGTENAKDRIDLTADVYAVTITDSNNCAVLNKVIDVPICSEDCNFFGGIDSLFFVMENCFDIAEFCFPILQSELINCQITDNGILYSQTLTSCDNDTFPNGYLLRFEPGFHEIIIIDTLNDCYDILIVNVLCSNTDELCINEEKEFCINAADLGLIGEIATMTNLCADSSGRVSFDLDLDNLCVYFEGKGMGVDTACIEICDFLGNCESFLLRVTVNSCLLSTPDFLEDTIFINETVVFCPDTSELVGDIVSVENFCPSQSGDFVEFFLDQNTFCVEYTGLEIGVDSACIEICDELGFCDTTFITIVVEENLIPPIAVDDCDTTNMGSPVVINILANDTLFGRVTSTKIITQPMWGSATVNLDRSVTYNASDEFCERIDSFQYEVCTDGGCDVASVCVWIECVDIFIFTAVSANKDGVNDVFYIAGVEDYPENILRIFNRWGNLVYEKVNYKNTWNGTYKGTTDLPDGTYFYLLELNDEENRVFKGFLELFR